ncbi:putative 26S proteasome non-ATPase regulatory subunit 6, partial [Gregarina niphandrodes]
MAPGHPADAIVPTYEVFALRHSVRSQDLTPDERARAKSDMLKLIDQDNMVVFYERVCSEFDWSVDTNLVSKMKAENTKNLKELQDAITEAEKQYGDVEIKDGKLAIAHHYCRIGDWQTAQERYEDLLDAKALDSTSKVNIYLTLMRIALFEKDVTKCQEWLDKAEKQFEVAGDWETRNRVRVYEAMHLAQNLRKFEKAAELLISSLATFTASELLSFEHFVTLTVLLSAASLERPILKQNVQRSPEVLQVLAGKSRLATFFNSLM